MADVLSEAEAWLQWVLYRDTIVATLRRYPEAKAVVIATFKPKCKRNELAADLVRALELDSGERFFDSTQEGH